MYKDEIGYADINEYEEIRRLFDICFPEDVVFNRWFFENAYKAENTLVYRRNGKIISMLQNIPCQMDKFGGVSYVYGACTVENSRRQGIMGKLLETAFEEDKKNKMSASVLIPQNPTLFGYYAHFGYKPAFFLNTSEYGADNGNCRYYAEKASGDDVCSISRIYECCVSIPHIKRTTEYLEKQISLFECAGGDAIIFKDADNKALGYAFLWQTEIPYLQEIFCIGNKKDALDAAASYCGAKKLKYSDIGDNTPFGCIKYHCRNEINENMYMNLMFN